MIHNENLFKFCFKSVYRGITFHENNTRFVSGPNMVLSAFSTSNYSK